MAGGSQKQTITVEYVATQAQKDAAKWAADEQKRTKETAATAAKAAKETSDAQKKAAKEASDAAKQADRERKDSNTSVNALLKEHAREETAAARASAQAQARAVKDAARQEIIAIREKHKLTMMQWQEQQLAAKANQAMMDAAASSVMGFMGAFAGFSAILGGVKAMSEYFAKLRADTFEAAKEVSHFREEVLELAAMKGQLGNSTPETVNQLKFRGKTGQSRQAALAMSTAMEGAGQAAIGKNVTQAAADEMAETAGKLQAMERSDPSAYGALGGTLMLESKKGTSGKDLAGMFNKEYEIQRPGKFLNMGQYAKQRQQLTSYVQTGAVSGPEAAGLLSALSLENSPDQAATMAEQILSSTSADFMRARGMKVLPGTEHETSAAYFQQHLGLKKTATAKETWEAAAKDINRAEKEAVAKGENFSADKYLVEHGLNNQQARRGYAAMAAVHKQGQWKQFQDKIDAPLDGAAITNTFNDRRGRDQTIQKQLGQTARDASMINASEGTALGGLKEVQEAAFDRLKAQHKITGTFAEWKNRDAMGIASDNLWDVKTSRGDRAGWHEQVNLEAQRMLEVSAKESGVGFDIDRKNVGGVGMRDLYMGDEALYKKQQEIQKAGGDPLSDVAADIKRAAAAMERTAAAIEGKKPDAAPTKPLAVKPPGPVARP